MSLFVSCQVEYRETDEACETFVQRHDAARRPLHSVSIGEMGNLDVWGARIPVACVRGRKTVGILLLGIHVPVRIGAVIVSVSLRLPISKPTLGHSHDDAHP